MSKKKFKRFDQYVKEAYKPPFELPVSEDRVIVINAPTGAQLAEAQTIATGATGGVAEQLKVVCGDAAEEVWSLVKDENADVMNLIVKDIMAHFGFGGDDPEGEADSRT
jgi:hypothetical protein